MVRDNDSDVFLFLICFLGSRVKHKRFEDDVSTDSDASGDTLVPPTPSKVPEPPPVRDSPLLQRSNAFCTSKKEKHSSSHRK